MRLIDADEFFKTFPELAIEPYVNAQTVDHPFYQEAYQTRYEEGKNDRPQDDLISREALKLDLAKEIKTNDMGLWLKILLVIDNAPTVEVPENEVNCVLTMFGECSYNKTGCSDCEIKDKIRKALKERPQGEWIEGKNGNIKCNRCGAEIRYTYLANNKSDFPKFCCDCGADMRGDKE